MTAVDEAFAHLDAAGIDETTDEGQSVLAEAAAEDAQALTTSEYRIRSTEGGGYWSGNRDGHTTLPEAEAALAEYRANVERDTFIDYQRRRRHLASLVIEHREVTAWHPIEPPREGPLPPVTA